MSELVPEQPKLPPIRRLAAGVIGAASIILPIGAGVEAFVDTPDLVTHSQEAEKTSNYLDYKYNGLVSAYEKDLELEQDENTGRLSVTLARDPNLTIEPIEQAFGSLEDTTNDVTRLKWLTIGGAVGLISAAGIGRLDRTLGKGGNLREALTNVADEHRGYFLALMLSAGIPTSFFLAGGGLQQDLGEVRAFDAKKAGEISNSMQADIKKLDIQIEQGEKSTKVSFHPEPEALRNIEEKSAELTAMMPNISDQDVALDQFMLSFAGLALIGAAGSMSSAASSLGRLKSGEKRPKRLGAEQKALAYLETRGQPMNTRVPQRNHARVRK